MYMTGRLAFSVLGLLFFSASAAAQSGPDIPEPMVFDMIRPLTAKAGEIEVNALAQRDLTGPRGELEWAGGRTGGDGRLCGRTGIAAHQ